MVEERNRLDAWDYVIMVLVLVISACIGIYYRFTGGKQKTVKVNIFLLFSVLNN